MQAFPKLELLQTLLNNNLHAQGSVKLTPLPGP